jgi:hypothetical protein
MHTYVVRFVKPNDFVYVSGRLGPILRRGLRGGRLRSYYEVHKLITFSNNLFSFVVYMGLLCFVFLKDRLLQISLN